jgi:hypothetical protein
MNAQFMIQEWDPQSKVWVDVSQIQKPVTKGEMHERITELNRQHPAKLFRSCHSASS